MVSEPTLAVSRACTSIERGHEHGRVRVRCAGMWAGAWRVSARASGMRRWHWTHGRGTWAVGTVDVRTWPRGNVPGLGLTDEDVGLLRG
ncbi:hypothetical protein C2845_PMPSC055681 [Panicum miliaceum]|uniref:Uncharacterized protein n=1 Tax=Panicum miliaceum TaxID=4540 RepID=A0A3L6PAR3_PANMI|nr:hypothetical protein C2845_PMPSC055681 [Panicum miliaceum]